MEMRGSIVSSAQRSRSGLRTLSSSLPPSLRRQQQHIATAKREKLTRVDDNNHVIGEMLRADMRRDRLLHRSTFVFVQKSNGNFVVQKRSAIKDYAPGMLDAAPGGCVGVGETYEENALREIEEEMVS